MSKYATEVLNREVLDVVRRMSALAEYREPGIKNHLERIRGYCMVVARGLDLSVQEVEVIANASQLHDIGEIGIPDAILTKAGKLSPYEWEVVKRHPVIGAEILRGSPSTLLQAGEIIALSHHERWDGSGYPYGLKGEDIPLSGRICAMADIFDALTTKRPYKDEVSVEEAYDLILESSGVLFDPQLVTVFKDHFDEFLVIRQNNI
ncbi:MAG TPA: HD domain-containing phosphohydrolase [Anaerolineales bacterium]